MPSKSMVLTGWLGERYGIIFTANQGDLTKSFWMRAVPQEAWLRQREHRRHQGHCPLRDHTTTPATNRFAVVDNCDDELASSLVPYAP